MLASPVFQRVQQCLLAVVSGVVVLPLDAAGARCRHRAHSPPTWLLKLSPLPLLIGGPRQERPIGVCVLLRCASPGSVGTTAGLSAPLKPCPWTLCAAWRCGALFLKSRLLRHECTARADGGGRRRLHCRWWEECCSSGERGLCSRKRHAWAWQAPPNAKQRQLVDSPGELHTGRRGSTA